jgi:hypothetical protein
VGGGRWAGRAESRKLKLENVEGNSAGASSTEGEAVRRALHRPLNHFIKEPVKVGLEGFANFRYIGDYGLVQDGFQGGSGNFQTR